MFMDAAIFPKELHFIKFSCQGKDLIAIDNRTGVYDDLVDCVDRVRDLCCRYQGIGSQGAVEVRGNSEHGIELRFYGTSGARCDAEGCGIAVGAALLRHLESYQGKKTFYIFPEGPCEVEYKPETGTYLVPYRHMAVDFLHQIEVEGRNDAHLTLRGPHHVCLLNHSRAGMDLQEIGRLISSSERYKYINGCNVTFVEVVPKKHRSTNSAIRLNAKTYDRGLHELVQSDGNGAVAGALVHCCISSQQDDGHSIHTATDDLSLHDKDTSDVIKEVTVRTDVIVQGEIIDEIMMEVKKVNRSHDPKEISNDLKHGGFGIQFNNAVDEKIDHVDEVQRMTYVIHYNDLAQFVVTFEVDSFGNFKKIQLSTPVKYIYNGNYPL